MYRVLTERSLLTGLSDMWWSSRIQDGLIPCVVLGYMAFALVLMVLLPGKRLEGPETLKGNIPVYKNNGFLCYIVTMAAFVVFTVVLKGQGLTPTVVYDRFDEVMLFLNAFSVVFCLFLYIKGRYWPSSSDSGYTGNFIFDYYCGVELYPRVFGVDIKVFTNCRFGLTVWPILVVLYNLKSYELHGFVNSIFISSVLQLVYITKFFWWEGGYMHTLDIILDRAGFYICWGCLVLVPSLYASVSMYMVKNPVHLEPITAVFLLGCGLACILINYWADLQKLTTRKTHGNCLIWGRKPNIIKAKYILHSGEEKESLLLVSGWWKVARHFNYLAELLLAFFWTAPCMTLNFAPYAYLTFLTILLVHRSFRDERKCSSKYGQYWKEYCREVPCRIVPYLI
ncbi:7-dehydrocholesterol reductase-like [Mizuhopecten yessoensis]|uniref:7-dehydrocholesterol reductase n=1 Tax=Mizuhopecten yessoensis TaxID=6573 RepID=A0A210PKA9_MIZYE|nr:7-dehydrocholesterol reductase-like [Mizuhopecten yessoensis]OWF36930.1 7-dehydrocholesterol reductase [Mizuhopecten yessoensis]